MISVFLILSLLLQILQILLKSLDYCLFIRERDELDYIALGRRWFDCGAINIPGEKKVWSWAE